MLSFPCALFFSLCHSLHTGTHAHTNTWWASWRRSSASQPGSQLSSGARVRLGSPPLAGNLPLRGECQPPAAFPTLPHPCSQASPTPRACASPSVCVCLSLVAGPDGGTVGEGFWQGLFRAPAQLQRSGCWVSTSRGALGHRHETSQRPGWGSSRPCSPPGFLL